MISNTLFEICIQKDKQNKQTKGNNETTDDKTHENRAIVYSREHNIYEKLTALVVSKLIRRVRRISRSCSQKIAYRGAQNRFTKCRANIL